MHLICTSNHHPAITQDTQTTKNSCHYPVIRIHNYRQSFFPNTIPHWNRLTTDVVNSSFKPNLLTHNL